MQIAIQLQRGETPAMLFRNIVRQNDLDKIFRIGVATYICTLKDKRTLDALNALLQTTLQVSKLK